MPHGENSTNNKKINLSFNAETALVTVSYEETEGERKKLTSKDKELYIKRDSTSKSTNKYNN